MRERDACIYAVIVGWGAERMTHKLKTDTLIGFVVVHIIAALALLPSSFSWTGFALFIVGNYVFGVLGINIGFHRLLTHRSFSCPLWFEHTLAVLGTCGLQFSPVFWVAVHRRHHHHADVELDPHSPMKSFLWAHFGWLLVRPPDMKPAVMNDRYARDLLRDPFYAMLERRKNWIKITLASWILFFAVGFAVGLIAGWGLLESLRYGASLLIWAGALRTVIVWHTTWAVNSVSHIWGYRNYDTSDDSRNNAIVGILAGGEGWHNNHHAHPNSARHGHKWWEVDLSWLTIKLLMKVGLANNAILPLPQQSIS